MQYITLAAQINAKLIDYTKKVLFVPSFIVGLELSGIEISRLRQSYPHAKIQNNRLNELEQLTTSLPNRSVDLLVANLAHARLAQHTFLSQVEKLLHKTGIGIFATFTHQSKALIEDDSSLNDENIILADLNTTPSLLVLSKVEPLTNHIACQLFIVSSIKDITYLKQFLQIALGEENSEAMTIAVQPEQDEESEKPEDPEEEEEE
jgi:hypothetical protein